MSHFTKRFIEQIQSNGTKELFYWDDHLPGFGLRVKPTGRKTFFIQYRNANGSTRRLSLGTFRLVDLEKARRKAALLLAEVKLDRTDPSAERKSSNGKTTFAEFSKRYIKEYALLHKKPRSVEEDQRLLNKFIIKRLGPRTVGEITKQDILKIQSSVSHIPIQANRLISLLSKMFNLAEEWGERPEYSNPCFRVRKFKETAHERFLSPTELSRLGQVLTDVEIDHSEPEAGITVIRLLILTGARKSELLELRWVEVDLEQGYLRLPDSKTGSKQIYLNSFAQSILSNLRKETSWVFPALRGEGHLVGLQKIWERIRAKADLADVRLHDLRHSFASAAVGLGESLPVLGKLLGHNQITTTQRYAHLSDHPIRQSNEKIGGYLHNALTQIKADVIPITESEDVI